MSNVVWGAEGTSSPNHGKTVASSPRCAECSGRGLYLCSCRSSASATGSNQQRTVHWGPQASPLPPFCGVLVHRTHKSLLQMLREGYPARLCPAVGPQALRGIKTQAGSYAPGSGDAETIVKVLCPEVRGLTWGCPAGSGVPALGATAEVFWGVCSSLCCLWGLTRLRSAEGFVLGDGEK